MRGMERREGSELKDGRFSMISRLDRERRTGAESEIGGEEKRKSRS